MAGDGDGDGEPGVVAGGFGRRNNISVLFLFTSEFFLSPLILALPPSPAPMLSIVFVGFVFHAPYIGSSYLFRHSL